MRRTVGLMLMVCAVAHAAVFPKPREIQLSDQTLALSENVPILLPEQATAEDGFLARFLLAEMSERHGLALRLERVRSLPAKGPFVLMGTMRNPLVAAYAGRHGLTSIAPEGYALEVNAGAAVVAGSDTPAPFTGSRRCGNWSARAASRALASAIGR